MSVSIQSQVLGLHHARMSKMFRKSYNLRLIVVAVVASVSTVGIVARSVVIVIVLAMLIIVVGISVPLLMAVAIIIFVMARIARHGGLNG